jgi:hypothetical protein
VKYWEDETYVQANSIYFEFFARILRETGRDPDILLTITRSLPSSDSSATF